MRAFDLVHLSAAVEQDRDDLGAAHAAGLKQRKAAARRRRTRRRLRTLSSRANRDAIGRNRGFRPPSLRMRRPVFLDISALLELGACGDVALPPGVLRALVSQCERDEMRGLHTAAEIY